MEKGKLFSIKAIALLSAFGTTLAQDGRGAFDGLGAHPGFTVSPISALGNVATMGIDWLSDGTMVWVRSTDNYGGGSSPGANSNAGVWLVSNITGTPSVTKISGNMRQPTGVAVGPNDEIMVPDRDAIYRFTRSGNQTKVLDNPVPNAWHQWIFTPMYYNGRYYAPYSGTIRVGGPSDANPTSEYSGAFLSWTSSGSGGFQKFAGGFRSCNGSGIGSGAQAGFMLVADNQGSWLPSCPVHIVRQNRFYGHRQNSGYTPNFAQQLFTAGTWPYDPPVAWMLDTDGGAGGVTWGGAGQATSQPLYLPRGVYAGDWIVGDINQQGLARIALDPVNGNTSVNADFNGSVHFFTGGFGNAALNRLAHHPTQDIVYVGTSSTAGCNWPCSGLKPFYQIRFNESQVRSTFEILAVKSRQGGVELIFSQPVSAASAVAGSFSLRMYNVTRQSGYGQGNTQTTAPSITEVRASTDRRRLFLNIGNTARTDRVLVINAGGIRSESGGSLFFPRTWFTHNYQSTVAFNPSGTSISGQSDPYLATRIRHTKLAGALEVNVDLPGAYTLSLRAFNGTQVEELRGHGTNSYVFNARGRKGLHVLQVVQGEKSFVKPVAL